jgi:hypothetical protein
MKRTTLMAGILLAALGAKPAHAEPGLLDRMLPSSAVDLLRYMKDSVTPAGTEKDAVFHPAALPEKAAPPQQHRDPAPAPAPQPPHRDPAPTPAPQPPHRNPTPTPAPQPPHRDPNPTPAPQPPHRDPNPTPAPQPPHRDPNPTPAPQPPHRDPNPTPAPQPPHRDPQCPDPRNPACPQPPHRDPNPAPQPPHRDPNPPHRDPNPTNPPHNPQRPPQAPPHQHPPVVIPPHQPHDPGHPGNPGDHRMPLPPKPVDPGHRMDPSHHGDDHSNRPPDRGQDGRPVQQHPGRDHDGRLIPPGRGDLGRFDNGDVRGRIHGRQDNWDRNDHGYHWDNWNGMPVCHHYDDFGFHWWGFYVGSSYYWTRFDADRFWWFDPYWHRWDYLDNGQWWWQDAGGTLFVYNGGTYYRYGYGDSGVVMTPDPTPPVDVPPGGVPQPAAPSAYSLDGTRSVQIVGDNRDAYLYDLTLTDANDPRAQGTWLASGVTNASFAYTTQTNDDGSTTQLLQQVTLSYDDPAATSTIDPNGERKVDVNGDAQNAYLYNLADNTVDPVFLAAGVNGVTMIDVASQDASGESVQSLVQIVVATTDGDGNPASLTFDRDGAAASAGSASFSPMSLRRPAAAKRTTLTTPSAVKALRQKLTGSEAFRALSSGLPGW